MNAAGDRYTLAARRCTYAFLRGYSTSFSLACRLLDPRTRPHVAAIYAWARVADELVDGGLAAHDDTVGSARAALAEHRERTTQALCRGTASDPIVHAFADTARRYGISARLIEPFYDSMEADLTVHTHTPESLCRYIYGSAEVIGEMCLRTFDGGRLAGDSEAAAGARALGAGFQKVNFLRDVHEDYHRLGRNYLPGHEPNRLSDADVRKLTGEIDADLALARAAIDRIPGRDRLAVLAAHDLFAELNSRIRAAGATRIMAGRVRVPGPVKLAVVARAAVSPARPLSTSGSRAPARPGGVA